MRIDELLLEQTKKKPKIKKPKPRPRGKVLWYTDQQLWAYDVKSRHPAVQEKVIVDYPGPNDDLALVDFSQRFVYGVWYGQKGRGVTYDQPRPIHTVVSPRAKLKRWPPDTTNTFVNTQDG